MNYTFSKYPILADQLKDEIVDSLGLTPYDIAYADADRSDNLRIEFTEELSESQETELSSIVSNHVVNSNYKIFKINDSAESPINIDYDIIGYHKKRTITFGELLKVEYYKNFDGTTYSDLVVEENRTYTRDVNGLVQYRTQLSKWFYKDGTVGATKETIKYYTLPEAIQEGLDRRSNVIAQAKAYVLSQVGQLYSFDLLTSVKDEIKLFIDGYTQPLRDAVQASTKPYLNQTIKDGIIENLRLI